MAVKPSTQSITATNSSTTSGKFDVQEWSCGSFLVPASVTAVAFYRATSMTDAAPVVIQTQGNAALSINTTAGTSVPFPAECFSHAFIVLVLTGSTSATVTARFGTSSTPSTTSLSVTTDSELTTADLDTGAGTDTRAVVGIVLAASGGAAALAGGAGTVSTGTPRVTLASNDPLVAALVTEDVASVGGEKGFQAMTVRSDTGAFEYSSNDGDFQPLTTDQYSRLWVKDIITADWDRTDACKSVAMQSQVTATCNGANTIAAAGDYAANDIISNSATDTQGKAWKFTGLARAASLTGTIIEAKIETSVAGFVPRTRWFLFSADPTTTERDDNAAFGANGEINSADRAKFLCRFDLPAMIDNGDQSWADLASINRWYQGDASGDVYAIIILLDAATNESAGMSVYPTLRVLQD